MTKLQNPTDCKKYETLVKSNGHFQKTEEEVKIDFGGMAEKKYIKLKKT